MAFENIGFSRPVDVLTSGQSYPFHTSNFFISFYDQLQDVNSSCSPARSVTWGLSDGAKRAEKNSGFQVNESDTGHDVTIGAFSECVPASTLLSRLFITMHINKAIYATTLDDICLTQIHRRSYTKYPKLLTS
jgi:hypothetical protein